MGSLMAGWDSPVREANQGFIKKNAFSLTKEVIANYWRSKRIIEQDHLLAAFKAAARIKAQRLTAEDYGRFEDSLAEEDPLKSHEKVKKNNDEETRIGIKDWWTRSDYAYLNQPPVKSMEEKPKIKYVAQFHVANFRTAKETSEYCSIHANSLKVF